MSHAEEIKIEEGLFELSLRVIMVVCLVSMIPNQLLNSAANRNTS